MSPLGWSELNREQQEPESAYNYALTSQTAIGFAGMNGLHEDLDSALAQAREALEAGATVLIAPVRKEGMKE
jgi:hypothetical protein